MRASYWIFVSVCLSLLYFGRTVNFMKSCKPEVLTASAPVVRIPGLAKFNGSVTLSLKKQRQIFQYLGIPYALPPMGPWRFKAPIRLQHLNENVVYETKFFKRKCPQYVTDEDYEYLSNNFESAEDCLYLNVFTPANSGEHLNELLPVLVNLHGGGYYQNSAMDYCPNYLLDHEIILVTVQYRLGPFGFLNLENNDINGNMGLLDQLEALKWVSNYIKYFGGDNKRITICGQSSGGVTASLMLTSPLVPENLFQQAIIQSGNSLANFVVDYHSKNNSIEFARYANCTEKDEEKLVECLRTISSLEIVMANVKFMHDVIENTKQVVRGVGISYVAVQNRSNEFLPEDPREIFENGMFLKIPILTGVTKDEGLMVIESFVDYVVEPTLAKYAAQNRNQSEYLENRLFYDLLKFIGYKNDAHNFEIVQDIFFPDGMGTDFNSTVPGLSDLAGMLLFKACTLQFARYTSQYSPTYLYSFNFKGTKTKLGYGKPPKKFYFNGIAHSDDFIYLFPFNNHTLNSVEEKVVEYMTSLWASFVINGGKSVSAPGMSKWPPMSTSVGPYLEIDEKLTIKENFVKTFTSHKKHIKVDKIVDVLGR